MIPAALGEKLFQPKENRTLRVAFDDPNTSCGGAIAQRTVRQVALAVADFSEADNEAPNKVIRLLDPSEAAFALQSRPAGPAYAFPVHTRSAVEARLVACLRERG